VLNTVFRHADAAGAWPRQAVLLDRDAADYYFRHRRRGGDDERVGGRDLGDDPAHDAGVKIGASGTRRAMRGTISHTIRYDCLVPEADVRGHAGSC